DPDDDHSDARYTVAGMIALGALLVLALVVRVFWAEAFKIPAGSMIPTLQVGDHVFVDKTAKHPRRGEPTVFIYPKEPDKDFIKRVVAVGGDTVEIHNN